tara:strand:- start:2400 stop:3020 length:621 start_codon:yes stop_codon:yes gene_type:complete
MNRFISFEGIDGSGKTTQIEILINKLKSANEKAISFREPGGTSISESIREILLNNKNSTLTDTAESLLFFASRSQLLSDKIIPLTNQGYFVICDRFNDSTIAYQGYGNKIDLNYLHTLSDYCVNDFKPDLTFFLDISVDLSMKRRTMKLSDRIESRGEDYLEKVRSGFLEIADNNPKRFIIIDGTDNKTNISNKIWDIVSDKYKIS